jgi:hypothetical protein
VNEPVSLIDLPATILDLAGLAGASPFPGRSLARCWRDPRRDEPPPGEAGAGAISELAAPNPINPSHGRSPAIRGPLVSLAEGDHVYIRNLRDGREQLFHTPSDPGELVNLAGLESMRPRLERLRRRVAGVAAGPAGNNQ